MNSEAAQEYNSFSLLENLEKNKIVGILPLMW